MTKREAAIIGAYTGILVGSFSDLHEYVEEIIGRPVFIHEMAFDSVADQIKRAATKDFMNLVIEDKEPTGTPKNARRQRRASA